MSFGKKLCYCGTAVIVLLIPVGGLSSSDAEAAHRGRVVRQADGACAPATGSSFTENWSATKSWAGNGDCGGGGDDCP
jgi:hypothetical protein